MKIQDYIKSLSDYEMIVLFKYRKEEMSNINLTLIEEELKKRNLSVNQFDAFQNLYKHNSYSNNNKCPRYKTSHLVTEKHSNIHNKNDFYLSLKYFPLELKKYYRCTLCGYKFKKWLSLKDIKKLINS